MCSIIGCINTNSALSGVPSGISSKLVSGLSHMEYRGYDSVGVSMLDDDMISTQKDVGKVSVVNDLLHLDKMKVSVVNDLLHLDKMAGAAGIGHTRWATHGTVNQSNAHPHHSNSGKISLVHNGVIANHEEIRTLYLSKFEFLSETDSEVIVNLIQYYYDVSFDPLQAVMECISKLEGHYSFIVLFSDGTIISAKHHEPLIIGVSSNEYFFCSDVLGFVQHTDDAIFLENKNIAVYNGKGLSIYDFSGKKITLPITKVSTKFILPDKKNFAHYTLSEITQQGDDTSVMYCDDLYCKEVSTAADLIKSAKNIVIAGSGTSYNAAVLAKFVFSKYAGIRLDTLVSSEVTHLSHEIIDSSVFVAISQSGESADIISSVKLAKSKNCTVVTITNNVESTLAQLSDVVIGISAGTEIGVAATKSYTAQIITLYKILCKISNVSISFEDIPKLIKKIINDDNIGVLASQLISQKDIYIIGRGIHYTASLEYALKIKELTYIHAESMFAGELKHGPLAQIDSSSLVIAIIPTDETHQDMLNTITQIKTRGGKILGISHENNELFSHWISLPVCDELILPILEVVISQLLSYHMATNLNHDPDHPQNLAKSVTVK